MPLYEYHNPETNENWDEFWSYDSHKKFLAENPNIEQVFAINIVGGTGDRVKADTGFGDMLGRIARANPTSPLAEQYGDKGIKASKTRAAIKKQQKKHNIATNTM